MYTDITGVTEQRDIEYALARVNDDDACRFVFYKVRNNFNSCTVLSTTALSLEAYHTKDDRFKLQMQFNTLFKVPTTSLVADDTIKFLRNCRSKPWPPLHPDKRNLSETRVFADIVSRIFVHLSSDITLEKQYWQFQFLSSKTVTQGDLGIGAEDTWHGTPDGRVRGEVNLIAGGYNDEEDAPDDDSSDSDIGSVSSDRKTTTIEAKRHSKAVHLSQVVATCVVAAFTEKNLHPTKSAMVPTILIDEHYCRVCLYDCEKDILLISGKKSLGTKGHLSQSAMVFLWAVLNHR